jgi:small-conductance mechanosensitive channel
MLEPIEIFGIDAFADSAVTIKARFKTRPLQQHLVGREYRRRLKKAFDAEGIEIPFPHRTLTMGQASPPFQFIMNPTEAVAEPRN